MKKDLTEMVFILDRSGSMSGLEADTIGGFNSMINKQKDIKGSALVSTVVFNGTSTVIYDRVDIDRIKPMTDKDYIPMGCTALLDALGSAIHHIGNIHKYARKEDIPENTIFVITTDGMENASKTYTLKEVKKMIKHQQSRYHWKFIFLGANIDAVKTAATMGIPAQFSANFHPDSKGISYNYTQVGMVIENVRKNNPFDPHWKDSIEDYNNNNK